VSEELSDFPAAFGKPDAMPWEEELPPLLWQWGADAGKPLRECSSTDLLRKRREIERRNGTGSYFQMYLDEIEQILTEREGEL